VLLLGTDKEDSMREVLEGVLMGMLAALLLLFLLAVQSCSKPETTPTYTIDLVIKCEEEQCLATLSTGEIIIVQLHQEEAVVGEVHRSIRDLFGDEIILDLPLKMGDNVEKICTKFDGEVACWYVKTGG
jgi:hypothetical protein